MARGVDTSSLRLFPLEGYNIHVPDGDNIVLTKGSERVNVRLAGIDAPEVAGHGDPGQPGHSLSTTYLKGVVSRHRHELQLWVDPTSESHGRTVGVILVGGRNINLEMVELGLVRAHALSGGTNGIRTSEYFKAQDRARENNLGIFRGAYYRALADITDEHGAQSHVRMSKPELLGKDFNRRLLATELHLRTEMQVLRGMTGGDHRRSTYGGFIGMNVNRPDFGASRSPHNPNSMRYLADKERVSALKSKFQDYFKTSGMTMPEVLMSLDIESTGVDVSTIPTFGGYVDVGGAGDPTIKQVGFHPTHPNLPDDKLAAYLNVKGDKKDREAILRGARRATPGRAIRKEYGIGSRRHQLSEEELIHELQSSGMGQQLKDVQLRARKAYAQELIDPDVFMTDLLQSGRNQGWAFIHNANFESRVLSPRTDSTVWRQAIETGVLAAGDPSYRELYNPFDVELNKAKWAAVEHNKNQNFRAAAEEQSKWLSRFVDMFTGRIDGPKGLKVVDTMDMARGLFATAHIQGIYQPGADFRVEGLLSQDVLGRMLGMKAEVHMPTPDAADNLDLVVNILEMQKELSTGKVTDKTRAFFQQAQQVQGDLAHFSLLKDISNQIRDTAKAGVTVEEALALDIPIRGEVPKKHTLIDRDWYIDGVLLAKDDPRIPELRVPHYDMESTTLSQYIDKRMGQLGIKGHSAEEIVESLIKGDRYRTQQLSGADLLDVFMGEEYLMTKQVDANEAMSAAMFEAENIKAVELEKAISKSRTQSSFWKDFPKNLGTELDLFWNKLKPETRSKAVGVGGIIASFGGLAFIRGAFEKRVDPEPKTMHSMEEYMVMKEMGLHANHDETELSQTMASFRMVPNRYPTKG